MCNERIKKGWAKLIMQYPFEWWVSLSFQYPVSQDIAKGRFLGWIRKICIKENLQIGCIAVFNSSSRIHGHALMLGRNRKEKNLLNVSMKKWAIEWCHKNCGKRMHWYNGARIRPVYFKPGVSTYFSGNLNLESPDLSEVFFYNRKLLKRCRIKKSQNYFGKDNAVTPKQSTRRNAKDQLNKESVKAEMILIIEELHKDVEWILP
jgi:hypothetical protein